MGSVPPVAVIVFSKSLFFLEEGFLKLPNWGKLRKKKLVNLYRSTRPKLVYSLVDKNATAYARE